MLIKSLRARILDFNTGASVGGARRRPPTAVDKPDGGPYLNPRPLPQRAKKDVVSVVFRAFAVVIA
jgi:hypothetical protein